MTVDASHLTPPISRRTLLHTAAGATVGLAGILATKTPPLYAATRTLTMLTLNHFVPASDENLKRWAKEFENSALSVNKSGIMLVDRIINIAFMVSIHLGALSDYER